MKIKKLIAASAAAMLALSAASVTADGPSEDFLEDHPNTGELMVKTTIKDACYLDRVGMLDFGELYPGWMGPNSSHMDRTRVKFRCTKGTAYEIKFDGGENPEGIIRHMKHLEPGDMPAEMTTIPYWLINGSNGGEINDGNELGDGSGYGYPHSGDGQGLSVNEELVVIGKFFEADIADVLPGEYKDTVTVTLCF